MKRNIILNAHSKHFFWSGVIVFHLLLKNKNIRMKKINLIVLLSLLFVGVINAQEYKKFYLGVGGLQSHFQDQKFSESQFRGIGGSFELGKDKQNINNLSGFKLRINTSGEYPLGHRNYSTVFRPSLNIFRLKKINDKLFIGGNWTVFDFYFRTNQQLSNNSKYQDFTTKLSATAHYKLKIRNKQLSANLNVGLISLSKMTNGFAYVASQRTLEKGNFNYQNTNIDSPFGGEGYSFKAPWKDFNIQTQIAYPLSHRFDLIYQWELRQYSVVKNYPTTYGNHTFSIRFNFIHK